MPLCSTRRGWWRGGREPEYLWCEPGRDDLAYAAWGEVQAVAADADVADGPGESAPGTDDAPQIQNDRMGVVAGCDRDEQPIPCVHAFRPVLGEQAAVAAQLALRIGGGQQRHPSAVAGSDGDRQIQLAGQIGVVVRLADVLIAPVQTAVHQLPAVEQYHG